jgi:hypothetical protein
MKTTATLSLTAATLLCAHALGQSSGTSHPELLPDPTNAAQDQDHYVPPSYTAPVPAPTSRPAPATTFTVIGPAVATTPDGAAATPEDAATPRTDSDDSRLVRRSEPTPVVTDDLNSGIVASVPVGPNELAAATRLKSTLDQDISTQSTIAGTRFSAVLTSDTGHNGRVLLPAGSIIHGRIAQIHGGRRIGGAAAIRLQPTDVTLPDGTNYRIAAEVVDLDHFEDSHVNSEGTIVANGHPKATAAALGLTTGSAVIAGALIGGGVGAVVGLGVGAGAGAIWWLKRDREQLLPKGTEIVFSLDSPLALTPSPRFGSSGQN